jgi:hypothetical protein
MCCVYDGLEPHNHYEPQQDTNNPISINTITITSQSYVKHKLQIGLPGFSFLVRKCRIQNHYEFETAD